MSNGTNHTETTTQSNQTGTQAAATAKSAKKSGVSTKWIVGMALGSAAGAALLVSSISSTSAEAPVLADSAHVIQASQADEKSDAKSNKSQKTKSDQAEREYTPGGYQSQSPRQYAAVAPSDNDQDDEKASADKSDNADKTPQYGKNANEDSKLPSKVKKPAKAKQNETEGKPPAGTPIEGPINHSE